MNKTIAAEEIITETLKLDALTITENGKLTAPAGKNVTLTVDGIHREAVPGTYTGAVVLEVTEGFGRAGGFGPPGAAPVDFTAVLRAENGAAVAEKSVLSALQGAVLTDGVLDGAKIVSEGTKLGGLDLMNGSYTLKNTDIRMNGYGGNDFSGKGAAISVSGDAKVEIDGLQIHNSGVIRAGIIATDDSVLHVKNSEIVCMGGDEEQYQAADADVGGMLCVPWQLGLSGNCRATSVLTRGTATYENSTISSYGWGALSVDGTAANDNWDEYSIHLNTKNCKVNILGPSGYGAFAIGPCQDVFENTEFNVATYSLIQANETASAHYLGCTVNSKRFGTMSYANQGGQLEVKDSTFNTGSATFLVKGCYPQITVENSRLNSEDGTILQMIDCDDPNYGLTGMDLDAQVPEKIADHDVTRVNYHDFYLYNSLLVKNKPTDLQITFKNMPLQGNLYNAITNTCPAGTYNPNPAPMGPPPEQLEKMIEKGEMQAPPPEEMPNFTRTPSTAYPANLAVSFEHVTYTGVITAAVARHSVKKSGKDVCQELGKVTNTACPVVNNGVIVSIDADSSWTVTGPCYLSALHLSEGAVLQGADGKAVNLTVNGVPAEILPGSYTGDVQLSI